LEADNKTSSSECKLTCCQGSTVIWADIIPFRVIALAGNKTFSAVACHNGGLYIYSASGRRIFPLIQTDSPATALLANKHFLLYLSSTAVVSVWDLKKQISILHNEKLPILLSDDFQETLLTEEGIPIISLKSGNAFCYEFGMKTWNRISDHEFDLSNFKNSMPNKNGILASLQTKFSSQQTDLVNRILTGKDSDTSIWSFSHLENQMAAALLVKSKSEYLYWLRTYVYYLCNQKAEKKLDELFLELRGPPHRPSTEISTPSGEWNPLILGIPKRQLLAEMIEVVAKSARELQRLAKEYSDQLTAINAKEKEALEKKKSLKKGVSN